MVTRTTRHCGSCVFFAEGFDGLLPGSKSFTGRCTHPSRQIPVDPQPWVRAGELPCRLKWDDDLWQPGEPGDDQVVDIRMIDPRRPGPGFSRPPRNLLQLLLILSDRSDVPDLREEVVGQALDDAEARRG